jgi:two-component system, cell cycle sensor histidine kinase DivJ
LQGPLVNITRTYQLGIAQTRRDRLTLAALALAATGTVAAIGLATMAPVPALVPLGAGLCALAALQAASRFMRSDATEPVQTDAADIALGRVAALCGSAVFRVLPIGTIIEASGDDVAAEIGRNLVERVNVADRPAFLLALSAAEAAPQIISLRLRIHAASAIELAQMRVVACGDTRLLTLSAQAAATTPDVPLFSPLAAEFAHDVRTPLAAMVGMADALANPAQCDASRLAHYPGLIAQAGRDALELADTLLDGSCGREEPIAADMVLGDAVARIVAMKQGEVAAHGASLFVRIPKAVAQTPVNGRIVRQILSNLIGNAAKHGGHGTSIELSARLHMTDLCLQVRDNGVGMPVLAKRGQGEPDKSAKGHGLGLSIVRRLAASASGHLAIDSQPDQGTTMTVWLRFAGQTEDTQTRNLVPAVTQPVGLMIEGTADAPHRRFA